MSGILSVILFIVASIGESYSWSVPIRLSFFFLAVIALYGSAYLVWRRERRRVDELTAMLTAIVAKRKVREAIGRLLASGNDVMAKINRPDAQIPIIKEAQEWMDNAATEIGTVLDSSYVARFHSAAGTGAVEAAPTPKNLLLAAIRVRLLRLNEFLADLAD